MNSSRPDVKSAMPLRATHAQPGANAEIALLTDELKSARAGTEATLCAIVDLFNPHLGGHSHRVATLVGSFAEHLNIAPAERQPLHQAAMFHDLGMLGIRRAALFTPLDKLDETDRNLILLHPEFGAAQLRSLNWLAGAAPIVLAHHERWDGTGYPHKLRGDAIPMAARILAVCDTYDEMMNKPPEAPLHFSEDQVVDHLLEQRGRHFEPRAVDTFLTILERLARRAKDKGPIDVAVTLGQLRPGHMLARDLVNAEGMTMLTKGTRLSEAHILRLNAMRNSRAVVEPVWVEP